jgi:PTS system mannose-specific IIA component
MLIKLAEARETSSLDEASLKAKEAGQRYIAIASKILVGES